MYSCVERLRSELGEAAADFIDAGTLSFSLLAYVEAADSMLVIDAADLDGTPGAIAPVRRRRDGSVPDERAAGAPFTKWG